jgi:uncharacterized protein (DUF1810 family)
MSDPFNLQRFLDAQTPVYHRVVAELRSGQKQSHWMWFIFPQIQGLGRSATAQRFAISGCREAQAYWQHPVLGARFRECTQLVNAIENRTVSEIFPFPDDLKFHSSITLFAQVVSDNPLFLDTLKKYFAGQLDRLTLDRL